VFLDAKFLWLESFDGSYQKLVLRAMARAKMTLSGANAERLALLTLLISAVFMFQPVSGASVQTTFTTINSYRVSGAPNYDAPGNESFWSQISWTNISLVASIAPGGGKTPSVLVKSANDGFNIYVLFRWKDSQGPSFGSSGEGFINSTTMKFQFLDPAHTSSVNQLVYNSTYYYPDRAAILWYIGNQTQRDQTAPQMKLGTNGALSAGKANIWHWQSNPTDNNKNDSGYAGQYTDPKGNLIFPPNNSSFAEDDYTDTSFFSAIAGNATAAGAPPTLDPYSSPFTVLAGNSFSPANKTWTVEMVRQLVVPQDAKYRVQLAVGSTYFVGFAVWNGKMGESSHIKSVSQWYMLTVTNLAAPAPPATAAGVSLTLAAATGIGLLVVGLIAGLTIRPERKKPKL
jgi:ethylbenzene dehydrogenase